MAEAAGLTVKSGNPLLNSVDAPTMAQIIQIAVPALAVLKVIGELLHTWLKRYPNSLECIRPGIYVRIGNMCSKEDLTKLMEMLADFRIKVADSALDEAPHGEVVESPRSFTPPKGIDLEHKGSLKPLKGVALEGPGSFASPE